MDKCAALTTLLENRPDRMVFTRLANGEISIAGMAETFTLDEVQMMLERRFGFDATAAATAVEIIRKTGVLDHPVPASALPAMKKTANSAVVVDMYQVDYTPRTIGESTQEIDKKLDIIKDFVTRYTFPDTTIPDVVVGPREQVLKTRKEEQTTSRPPESGASTPLEKMTRRTVWHRMTEAEMRVFDIGMSDDKMPGGRADDMTDDALFDPIQLEKGTRIEQEHTSDPQLAREIARDHLSEIPDYYTRLESMERKALAASSPTTSVPRGVLDRVVQPATDIHQQGTPMPHDQNYVHVAPSPLGGVGLFSYRAIPNDTLVYATRPEEDLVVSLSKVRQLPLETQQLYKTFGVVLEGKDAIVVPKNFNHMSVIWYINHSDSDPNVMTPDGSDYYTTRDVAAGEELLVNYNSFDTDENIY